jgi:hypothetical protein
MPLANSIEAIGATSELLESRLTTETSATQVEIGRPEDAATETPGGSKINLFLYQIDFDASMRNTPLDRGQQPPLWFVLRYLITVFDSGGESDSSNAHRLMGEALLALHELNFLSPAVAALADNPEPLKITFDSADADLLAKLMQGSDEKYRFSAAFQVRPIMVASSVPPSYAPLVLTVGPPGNEGVVVIPSMGPRADSVEPAQFEAGQEIVIAGGDLGGNIEVCIGDSCFAPDEARADRVTLTVPPAPSPAPPSAGPSAGSYPVTVVRILPSGRRFASNAVFGNLLPTLTSATPVGVAPASVAANRIGDLTLVGERLGDTGDDIFVAFYRDREIARMLAASGNADQRTLTVTVSDDDAIPAGSYRIILRVNGTQAAISPEVNWS